MSINTTTTNDTNDTPRTREGIHLVEIGQPLSLDELGEGFASPDNLTVADVLTLVGAVVF